MSNTAAKTPWYPAPAPALDGEDDGAYTDRLTGADRTGREPYDHQRYRECSMGYHNTCSQRGYHPGAQGCQCPCHSDPEPAGAITPDVVQAAEILAGLYYLPDSTARRCMALAADAGGVPDLVRERIGAHYGTDLTDGFVTDVCGIFRHVTRS